MAYISHSGTDNESQYDWKVLIFMVLLLVSILVFVAIKFLFPDVVAGPNSVLPDQAKNSAPAASANKTEMVPQIIPPERLAEKKAEFIAPAPKTTKSTSVNDPKNSMHQTDTENLLCSKSDRASGLCQ